MISLAGEPATTSVSHLLVQAITGCSRRWYSSLPRDGANAMPLVCTHVLCKHAFEGEKEQR